MGKVAQFAADHGLGFHLSPEIVGTKANPELRGNTRYAALLDRIMAGKRRGDPVLGTRQYLHGIRDFGQFVCHPLLMPVIRPDGRLYYPCLEHKHAEVSILEAGSYENALRLAQARHGGIPVCRDCCHIFCHMGLSLLQRHPVSAMKEHRTWAGIGARARRSGPLADRTTDRSGKDAHARRT